MNTNLAKQQSAPKPPPSQPKPRLRDDPTFIALYGQILSGLYSRFKPYEKPYCIDYDLHDEAAFAAKVAYAAARCAYKQLLLAEPNEETEQQVQNFNAILGNPAPKAK